MAKRSLLMFYCDASHENVANPLKWIGRVPQILT